MLALNCHGSQTSNTATVTTEAPVQPGTGYSFGVLALFIGGLVVVAAEARFARALFRRKGRPNRRRPWRGPNLPDDAIMMRPGGFEASEKRNRSAPSGI